MRGRVLVLIFSISVLLISIRYFQIQILQHEEHRKFLEEVSFLRRSVPAERGRIISSDGVVLASDEKFLVARLYGRKFPTLEDLEDVVGKRRALRLILGEEIEVSPPEAERLKELGVIVYEKIRRVYSGIAPHVVGYCRERRGISGVEIVYDDVLKGENGTEIFVINAAGKTVGEVLRSPPIPGKDIVLTIDSRLQRMAQRLLKGKRGVIILEDPRNGEILALASSPSFDPNLVSRGMSAWEWKKILNDPSGIFLNRAISSRYPPGSSIKPFIALSYLLKFNDTDDTINCKGVYRYVGKSGRVLATYRDWLPSGHGLVDMKKAIRVSCNVYFYTIGQKIGIDFLSKVASSVKLSSKTGIDLPGEIVGIFPSREWKKEKFGEEWYPGDTILLSIGQGYLLLTPIEMITFYSMLANEGISFVPHVLKGKKKEIFSKLDAPKWVWDFLREAMIEVTSHPGNLKERGTAYRAFKGFKIKVAGKTGTAEVPGKTPHSWFIGYAPADNPKVVVLVLIENGGSGALSAAPIARKMLEEYFSIFPVESGVKSGDEEQGQKRRDR